MSRLALVWNGSIIGVGLLLSNTVLANQPLEQIKLPQCLAKHITSLYQTLVEDKNFKLIELPSKELDKLTLLAHKVKCGGYINVSNDLHGDTRNKAKLLGLLNPPTVSLLKTHEIFYEIAHNEEVDKALDLIVADNIWQTLTHLTSYYNRSATSDTGVETAQWLKSQFEQMAVEYGRDDTATYFVDTGWFYDQPSVVTVIGKDLKTPAVVVGAHMDTLGGRMPGAGDDGSGSSSIMETARALMASKAKLKHPVYFIWYAAEERGLVGSKEVVKDFLSKSIPVKAVLQFDMTGYRVKADDPTMWVFKDYVDPGLSQFVEELITTYVHVPVKNSKCGYGCSDHVAWHYKNIPVAFPCESSFEEHNPHIHTSSDSIDLMNLEHMTNFSKLALAFTLELAL